MARRRADVLVVEHGLAASRARAQALILAGAVLTTNEMRVDKPGQLLDEHADLRLRGEPLPFVSRGGIKLQAALEAFAIDVAGRTCMDVGASTGGFTDCLIKRGARRVYAVDVGYGQLAWTLRQDPRVVVIERANIRTLPREMIPDACQLVAIDVSFISLRLVLPKAMAFAAPGGDVVALVKPQFEVGREAVGKGGVVRDAAARGAAVDRIAAIGADLGLAAIAIIDSPLRGAKGNQEYLLRGICAAGESGPSRPAEAGC